MKFNLLVLDWPYSFQFLTVFSVVNKSINSIIDIYYNKPSDVPIVVPYWEGVIRAIGASGTFVYGYI